MLSLAAQTLWSLWENKHWTENELWRLIKCDKEPAAMLLLLLLVLILLIFILFSHTPNKWRNRKAINLNWKWQMSVSCLCSAKSLALLTSHNQALTFKTDNEDDDDDDEESSFLYISFTLKNFHQVVKKTDHVHGFVFPSVVYFLLFLFNIRKCLRSMLWRQSTLCSPDMSFILVISHLIFFLSFFFFFYSALCRESNVLELKIDCKNFPFPCIQWCEKRVKASKCDWWDGSKQATDINIIIFSIFLLLTTNDGRMRSVHSPSGSHKVRLKSNVMEEERNRKSFNDTRPKKKGKEIM